MVSSVSSHSLAELRERTECHCSPDRSVLTGDGFCELRFPSSLSAGLRIVDDFVARVQNWGASTSDVFALRHGMHEAVVNAIRHGNGADVSRQVRVAWRFAGTAVELEVEDEGRGFCFQSLADPCDQTNLERPGGRGLLLMRHFMHSVEYNDRGNVVRMRRDCAR